MISPVAVRGQWIDGETRCVHYHSERDIIAIKFKCCATYYPCFQCHEESANHLPSVWLKTERDEKAILCGSCKKELTIHQYLSANNRCPACNARFNPNCELHYHLSFEV
jgi:uncharacterized CHY-type Zn-finger protein